MSSTRNLLTIIAAVSLAGCTDAARSVTAPRTNDSKSAAAGLATMEKTQEPDNRAAVEGFSGALIFMAEGNSREMISNSAVRHADGSLDGRFLVADSQHRIEGSIVCFTIVGNTVRIAGRADRSTAPLVPIGTYLVWNQVDNDVRKGKHGPDFTTQVILADQPAALTHCAVGVVTAPELPAIAGAIELHPEVTQSQ